MTKSTAESLTEVVVDLTEKAPIRILHVDDETGFLKVAKQCLEMEGTFQVDTAVSVEEALKKMKKKTFDVIVSDYMMPEKDGLEFLKELREKKNNIPFIMFTGKGREEVAINALNFGADQYLNKIGDPETVYGELAHGIHQAVEKSEVSIKLRQSLENIRRRSDELATLMESSTKVMRTRDLHQRLKIVAEAIRKIGWRRVVITVRDENLEMTDLVTEGLTKEEVKLLLERKSPGGVWRERLGPKFNRFKIGEFYYLPWSDPWVREKVHGVPSDASPEEVTTYAGVPSRISPEEMVDWHPQDLLYAPLCLPDRRIVGIISIDDPSNGRLPNEDSLIPLELFLYQAAVAIENAQLMCDLHAHGKVLQRTNARLQALIQAIPNVIYFKDAQGRNLVVNKAFEKLVGMTQEEIIGKTDEQLFPPDLAEYCRKSDEEVLKKRRILSFEEKTVSRKGEKRFFETIKAPIYDSQDNAMGLVGVSRDITERKQMEEALRESEEKYRKQFEEAMDAIFLADAETGIIIDCNNAASELLGREKSELIGKHQRILHPSREIEGKFSKTFKKHLKEKEGQVLETQVITKKGETIDVAIKANVFQVRGKRLIQGIFRDITKRKHFEERLSALNTYSRNLNTAESMKEIYRLTLDAMEKTLGFENASFMVVDENVLCVSDQRGYPEIFSLKLPLKEKKGLTVKVAKTGRPVLVPDIRKERDYVEGMPNIRSELAVPIKIGDKILGVLNVENKRLNAFDEKDQKLLEILASHAATAISNLQYAKNLEMQTREIQESQEKFERLFIENPEAALYLSPGFHILDSNPRFTELFGYSLDEVKGKHINDVIVPKDKIKEAKMLDEKARKRYVYHDTLRKRKDGTLVPVSVSAAPIIVEDQPIGYVGVYKDITEGKRFEERLSALNIYSRKLNMAESMEEIYRLTLDAMEKTLGFENAAFMVVDKEMLRVADQRGFPEPHLRLKLPLNGTKGLTVKVAKTGKPVLVPDIRKERTYVEIMPGIHSELDVPIKIGHKVLGVLNVENKRLNAFDEKDQKLLEILASHAATAISNLQYAKNLEMQTREIQESQEKFERLFMNNPEAADFLDPTFHIMDVNPRFEELFGYSLDEVKGKHINDVIVPKDKIKEAKMLDERAGERIVYHDTVRKRKDGSLVHVSISAAPIIVEGKLVGTMGLYKDITERKKAEEELEESRKHFQMLFNVMVDPVVIVDGKGKFLEITDKVEEITGFKKEELLGKNFFRTKIVTAKSKAILIKNLAKRMIGMHIPPYEVEVLTKDGRKLPYEVNAAKIEYKSKPADLVAFRDISERKKMEEKLRVVGKLTRHDVRNKLSAVTGNVFLAKRRLTGDHEALEYLEEIESACRQVERIFHFARIYERLSVEELVYMDVERSLEEAISLFSDLHSAKIVNDCHGLTVLADSLLNQLFYNLIDNSLKHGEKVSRIRVYYEEMGKNKLKMVYEDDGIGIPKTEKEKIFKEGYGKHTGYGLYLIRRMCEVYGWTIRETGKHGKGVQFTISIPKANENKRENYRLH